MNKFFFILFAILGLSIQPALAYNQPSSVAPLVKQVYDSVVNISASLKIKSGDDTAALGSGFVYDAKQGLIITNNHVVERSDKIDIYFHNGTKLPAKIIGRDAKTDIALLQVTPDPSHPLTQVTFGDSDKVEIGDRVLAVGNPLGFGGSVSLGIISAKDRDLDEGPYDDYLQTDAAINKGNSGGPLFDMNGEVIGMNSAIVSPTGGSVGLGFSIPSDTIHYIVKQLQEKGKIVRGYIGVEIQEVSDDLANALGLPDTEGAIVTGIVPNSPAQTAKLHIGDVILKANGKEVSGYHTLPKLIAKLPTGTIIPLDVFRRGTHISVQVTLAPLYNDEVSSKPDPVKPDSTTEPPPTPESEQAWGTVIDGLKIVVATPDLRTKYGHKGAADGVIIINFILNSDADKIGLKVGDIITQVNQNPINTTGEFVKEITLAKSQNKSMVSLQIENKNGAIHFFALPVS